MAKLWLVSRFWRILKRIPRFLLKSLNGTTDFPFVRPWLTDALRGRIVGWSGLGAIGFGVIEFAMLHQYYTRRVGWWMVGIVIIILTNTVVCFWLRQATGPSSDWIEAHTPRSTTQQPKHSAVWVRVVAVGTFIWVGMLIHWTGGPLLSPFGPFGILIIVLGQFLASTVESHVVLALLGMIFFAVLIVIHPHGDAIATVFQHGVVPLDEGWFRAAHWLSVCAGYGIGVAVNVQITEPEDVEVEG